MKIKFIFIISFCLSSFLFAQYSGGSGSGYGAGSSNVVSLSAFLQGPFSGGSMTTALNTNNFIPLTQPYNGAPWNYTGTESVASGFFSTHTNIVDWVLVELRTTTASSSTVQKRACFIKSDGSIVDLDGTSPVKFDKTDGNTYYVVIRHRNHLAVMSANALTLSSSLAGVYLTGGSSTYNFSSAQTQAYGTGAMKDLGSGFFGLYNADTDGSGTVNASDRSNSWNQRNLSGYYGSDVDLSGTVTATDRSTVWNNRNIFTQVP